jgi:glycosyltransferase involved in cell wall biosynthesis
VWHARDRLAADYLPARTAKVARWAVLRLPDAVVANSAATRATVPARERVWVVPSPGAEVAPRPAREAGAGFRVGVVGRLAPWKGQEVFVRAFAAAFPDGGAEGAIVGAALFGEDAYATRVERLATDAGIEMRGWRDDVQAELHRLDVLVHCSTVPEPFGQVVVEGMAAGLAVVASDAGGPAEIVTDGHDGLLVPPGDVTALGAALRRLRDDPELRERLGRNAVETAKQYRPEAVAASLRDVYDTVRAR